MRLKGGADARLYRYQQVAEEKRVLRLLCPALDAQSRGAESPVIQHVCGNPSVLGGVFEVTDLLPGQPLGAQPPRFMHWFWVSRWPGCMRWM